MESMERQLTSDQILAELRALKPVLAQRYGVTRISLFGSYVHNTQNRDSDVDILVSFEEPPSLLRFLEMEDFLSDALGVKVDLVMEDSLKPNIGRRILRDRVAV
jgi:uncharacterized protein